MAELKVRRPDSSMAFSVSCGSYDATRKVSPTPTVPKKTLILVRNLTITFPTRALRASAGGVVIKSPGSALEYLRYSQEYLNHAIYVHLDVSTTTENQ